MPVVSEKISRIGLDYIVVFGRLTLENVEITLANCNLSKISRDSVSDVAIDHIEVVISMNQRPAVEVASATSRCARCKTECGCAEKRASIDNTPLSREPILTQPIIASALFRTDHSFWPVDLRRRRANFSLPRLFPPGQSRIPPRSRLGQSATCAVPAQVLRPAACSSRALATARRPNWNATLPERCRPECCWLRKDFQSLVAIGLLIPKQSIRDFSQYIVSEFHRFLIFLFLEVRMYAQRDRLLPNLVRDLS